MLATIRSMFQSKKVMTFAVGVIVSLISFVSPHFSVDIDPAQAEAFAENVLILAGILIGAQGMADWGKEAAKANTSLVVLIALTLGVGVTQAGCAQNERRDTIHATVIGADGFSAALVAYDRKHQANIIATATSREGGAAELAAWRAKRSEAVTMLLAVYRAAYVAEVANNAKSLSDLLALSEQFRTKVAELTGGAL